MSKSSPAQQKAAPRKTVPQQAPPPTSKGQSKGQSKSSPKGSGNTKGQPVVKKRGTFLTVALALMTIGALVSAILPFVYRKNTIDITTPWLIGGAIAVGLLGLAGVVLMWFWKKLGIYLFVANVLGSIALGLVVYPSMLVAFHELIPLLVLGAALSKDNKMPLFE